MNLNIKSIFKPIFTFLFFVLFSQIILPFFKKDNFPPFFIWSLFSKNPTHWTFYDLEIIDGAGETKYYTDMHIGDAELWQTLQNAGRLLNSDKTSIHIHNLKIHLKKNNLVAKSILIVNVPLTKYVTTKSQEKKNYVQTIYTF